MKKPDIILEALVEFTPALIPVEGSMEIPIKVGKVKYLHTLKESPEVTERRNEQVMQTRCVRFYNNHRQLDIQRGDTILIEGSYDALDNGYDAQVIHRISGVEAGRSAIVATYYIGPHKPTRDQIVPQFPE